MIYPHQYAALHPSPVRRAARPVPGATPGGVWQVANVPGERVATASPRVRKIDLKAQRSYQRYDLVRRALDAGKWILLTAALWLPIQGMQAIAETLAGRTTTISVGLTRSLTYAGATAIATIALTVMARSRKNEIKRLRARMRKFEAEAGITIEDVEPDGEAE